MNLDNKRGFRRPEMLEKVLEVSGDNPVVLDWNWNLRVEVRNDLTRWRACFPELDAIVD